MTEATGDYEVGYRRPPQKNRFQPGQSGNPKGRPKGARNIAKILDEELDRLVAVQANGERAKISKRRLMIRQIVDRAAKGDLKAFVALTKLINQTDEQVTPEGREEAQSLASAAARKRDEEIVENYLKSILEDGDGDAP